jgi:hypothetical protein
MPQLPGQKPVEQFPLKLRGSFGRFKTPTSHELQFITTTLTISEISTLQTASELLDPRDVNFDELMQRDIDEHRVADIADNYLSSALERAVFFPPLLVCVTVKDSNGRPKASYTVESQPFDQTHSRLRTVYDSNAFQVDLYTAPPAESERSVTFDGQMYPVFEWASELAVNPKRAALMVLDGQHRLKALKRLANNPAKHHIVAEIEQPICVLWVVPEAGQVTRVVTDLRELFVRVNTEPKRVSGHFILLLRDTSYSAVMVRKLADSWKRTSDWSRLHLLEWNTREDESTLRRQRDFSITTISILDDALRDLVFGPSDNAAPLLRLEQRKDELAEIDPRFNYRALRDLREAGRLDALIIEQLESELVPAIDILLRNYRPYRALEKRLEAALVKLEARAKDGDPASLNLQTCLERFTYRAVDMTDDLARNAFNAFRVEARPPEVDATYFHAVYQRGYLRAWVPIARTLAEEGVRAVDSARAFVAAMEQHVGAPGKHYLDREKPYVNRVLWRGNKVNFSTDWARRAWQDIQTASLVRKDVRDALTASLTAVGCKLTDPDAVSNMFKQLGLDAARTYARRLHDEIVRDVRNNLAIYFGGEIEASAIRELRITDPLAFDARIAETARLLFDDALGPLADQLQVTRSDIEPND